LSTRNMQSRPHLRLWRQPRADARDLERPAAVGADMGADRAGNLVAAMIRAWFRLVRRNWLDIALNPYLIAAIWVLVVLVVLELPQ
jgi:hypothetical protein